jgi:hypothetical protein
MIQKLRANKQLLDMVQVALKNGDKYLKAQNNKTEIIEL